MMGEQEAKRREEIMSDNATRDNLILGIYVRR